MKTQTKPVRIQLPHARKSAFSTFGSLTALAAGLAMLGGPSNANAQADNFSSGDDTFPILWGHVDSGGGQPGAVPNTYDASTFQYHLKSTSTAIANGLLGVARTISCPADIYTDFYMSVDLVDWDNTYPQAFGLIARAQELGLATSDGYTFGIANVGMLLPGGNYVQILRLQDDFGLEDVHGSGPDGDCIMPIPDLDPTKDYRIVFMGKGTDLEGRLYQLPNVTTPIAVVKGNTAPDAIIHTTGTNGITAFNLADAVGNAYAGDVDATFDNYYASARCPMTITDMVVKDNFNDGSDTSPPIAWTHYDPLTVVGNAPTVWSYPGGAYRMEVPLQTINPAYGQGRAGSVAPGVHTDFRLAVDLVGWDDTLIDQDLGIFARLSNIGLGSTDGYLMSYDVQGVGGYGDIDISLIDGEGADGLALSGEDSFDMIPGKSYRFVFSGKGSELRAMVFELPETMNPVVDMVATDTTYASGQAGLLVAAASDAEIGDGTFDNWSDTALAAPAISLTFGSGTGGEFTVTWPANIECVWILESTTSLNRVAVWTQVPTTTTNNDAAKLLYDPGTGMNTYTAAAPMTTSPNTYYRLKQL